MTIFGDWRDTDAALTAVRPDWRSLPADQRQELFAMADGLIKAHRQADKRRCANCGAEVSWHTAYRCWDCKLTLCEGCTTAHFGPRHQPHPLTLEQIGRAIRAVEKHRDGYLHDTHTRDPETGFWEGNNEARGYVAGMDKALEILELMAPSVSETRE